MIQMITPLSATQEQALESFTSGLNCAQSVITSYAERFGFDEALAADIACAFGGGMGRLQKTCGAVTGAFMALSIYNAGVSADAKERKEKTYQMVQAFNRRFTEMHGTTQCRSLLGCDLNTEMGREYAKTHNLTESVCRKCVLHAVQIVDELIGSAE
ncbi:MAG: C-GCAxxG-C-C family protein [Acidobacteriota bacterium]